MVKDKIYIPERGDIVWLTFTPVAGHEQSGRRPALVLSPGNYNTKTGLMIACPITSTVKGYPFEVFLSGGKFISGTVLADQIRSLDWIERNTEFIEKAEDNVLSAVVDKVKILISF